MELAFLPAIEWRETLIVIVVLLTIYIAYVYLRMQRLKREALRVESVVRSAAESALLSSCSVAIRM